MQRLPGFVRHQPSIASAGAGTLVRDDDLQGNPNQTTRPQLSLGGKRQITYDYYARILKFVGRKNRETGFLTAL
jgi:hypothetical protein